MWEEKKRWKETKKKRKKENKTINIHIVMELISQKVRCTHTYVIFNVFATVTQTPIASTCTVITYKRSKWVNAVSVSVYVWLSVSLLCFDAYVCVRSTNLGNEVAVLQKVQVYAVGVCVHMTMCLCVAMCAYMCALTHQCMCVNLLL